MISLPSGVFMSTVMLRLFGWRFWKSEPLRPPTLSSSSPGISTLMTWAPISESWRTQVGPERARVKSRMRIWDNGSIGTLPIGGRRGPAVMTGASSERENQLVPDGTTTGVSGSGCWVSGITARPPKPSIRNLPAKPAHVVRVDEVRDGPAAEVVLPEARIDQPLHLVRKAGRLGNPERADPRLLGGSRPVDLV